ncbi:MAG: hypothetical protein N3F04_00715 [Candidatus Nezhaarchaeota archaeon]|nr:hypothetical protein [Candidatus Nezhaarchaeota archaeon]MCX8141298.1 hypothetical protein [Candidatus Nezhaarchaeota archaeon]MDW8049564.1 hypothetical protein [Nitrososphaerota archaeon]
MVRGLIRRIVVGAVEGFTLFILFAYIMPLLVGEMMRFPVEFEHPIVIAALIGVFISLGVISSSTKPCIGVVFSATSLLLGLLILIDVLGVGVVEVPLEVYGTKVTALFEFKMLLFTIIGFSVIFTIMRMFEKLLRSEE